MISTIMIAAILLLVGGWLIATRSKMFNEPEPGKKDRWGDPVREREFNTSWLIKPVITLVLGVLIAFVQPYSLERVDSSGVGFKVHLTGNQRGISNYEYKTGWVVFNTWTDRFVEIPINQQHIEYDTIDVITKGGFQAKITPSFNYAVVSANAADMYVELRKTLPEIEQGWLKNAIYSSVNDVANKWSVDSIFNSREQFEASIIMECNKRVSKWFTVSQLRSNIMPPPALTASILAKTKAIQDVQVAENQRRVAVAQAETNVATAEGKAKAQIAAAKGDSAQVIISANAQAEAIRIQQKQLSPLYIDYIRASNWNGVLPSTILGSGSQTLFNLK